MFRKLIGAGVGLAAVILVNLSVAPALERTGLPLDLEYFMTKQQVEDHLKALMMYRLEADSEDDLYFKIEDTPTNTYNGLHLHFENNQLVSINSGKYQMTRALFEKYMSEMLKIVERWKKAGMAVIMESPETNQFIYEDSRSVVIIIGQLRDDGYSVDISFSERKHAEKER